jgi:hypothetical protein
LIVDPSGCGWINVEMIPGAASKWAGMKKRFDSNLRKLVETPLEEHTEQAGRSALVALVNEFADEAEARGIDIWHEPRRAAGKSAPDFKIKHRGMILGYIEVK